MESHELKIVKAFDKAIENSNFVILKKIREKSLGKLTNNMSKSSNLCISKEINHSNQIPNTPNNVNLLIINQPIRISSIQSIKMNNSNNRINIISDQNLLNRNSIMFYNKATKKVNQKPLNGFKKKFLGLFKCFCA